MTNETTTGKPAQTFGEQRIRTNFNASGSSEVDAIKKAGADFINLINGLAPRSDASTAGEFNRLKALAMTSVEEGTMWAVKAATV